MLASSDNSIVVNLNFFGNTKGDDLFADSHTQAREVIAFAFRPLEVDVLEGCVLASLANV